MIQFNSDLLWHYGFGRVQNGSLYSVQSFLDIWKVLKARWRWGINELDQADGVEKAENFMNACT